MLKTTAASLVLAGSFASVSFADEITYVSGSTGNAVQLFADLVKPWEEATGHSVTIVPMPSSTTDQFGQYRLWLAAGNADVDVYQTDVIWAPQLADQFLDLSEAAKDVAPLHFPAIIESQTVNGKLVALPIYTDAPALYYRKDLLEKHGATVPTTWEELTTTAQMVQDAERADGNENMWGFVFQANAYEGLTCNALEWVKSFGGGQIIEPDGSISINNPKAIAAIDLVKTWVGTIAPEGVLAYQEEDARGVWQTGNAVFMRNWPYAYGLGNGADSPISGKFDVVPLPTGGDHDTSAATLGGWNAAVSKYSEHPEAATSLVLYLANVEAQKERAITESRLPTIMSLYDDADVAKAQPIIPNWKNVFLQAVPRPSAPTKVNYNEVSSVFWTAVHNSLSGSGTTAENFELLEFELEELKGSGW
jgi:trehalose/maltose transport system substrate-binding protein